ncbi:MAG: hypothetical protein CMJ25_23645 [Phycisphaerae bacterium]|nr:hypothetical protein [Phycisphaerae bacterium]
MSSNLDHWYPPATVRKNEQKDCWEYRVGKNSSQLIVHRGTKCVHKFFKTRVEATNFAEDELKNHQISSITIYSKNGDVSSHKKSRLHKAIQEYKREAVAEYQKEFVHMEKYYRNKFNELKGKASNWEKLQSMLLSGGGSA